MNADIFNHFSDLFASFSLENGGNSLFALWSSLWGAKGKVDGSLVAETIIWVFILIAFIIFGIAILMRLRQEAQNPSSSSSDNDEAALFHNLYKKKLITFDEYQTIKKNIRDKLVYDVYLKKAEDVRQKKNNKNENDREKRLKSLLHGIKH